MNPEIQQLIREEARKVFSEMANLDQFRFSAISSHAHNTIDAPSISQTNILPNTRVSGNITMTQATRYSLGSIYNPTSVWFYGLAYKTAYVFTVTAANATLGATYTNNSQTFTVLATIAGGTTLYCVGTGAPQSSGTLTKASGTGDATITFSAVTTQIITRAHIIGNAQLGATSYLQPDTSTSVKVGGVAQTAIQSSTMFLIDSFAQDTVNGVSTPVVRAIADEGHIIDVEYGGILVRASVMTAFSSYTESNNFPSGETITINVSTLATGWTIQGNWVIT